MLDLIQDSASWLQALGAGAYWLILIIVFLETFIVIGQFIPGSILLAFIGFLCYLQIFDFGNMLFSVFVGHYLGELTNYYVGRAKGRQLFHENSRFLKPSLLDMAERRFAGGGLRIFVIAQFTGMIRPFVSFAAGATHYPFLRFALQIAFAGFLWSIAPLGLGFILGESWQKAVRYFEGLSIIILVLIPTVLFSGWLIRRLVQHAGAFAEWLERVSRKIHRSQRYQNIAATNPAVFRFLEARLSLTKPWGIGATAGFVISAFLLALFIAMLREVRVGFFWRDIDSSLVNLLGQLRRPAADSFFVYFAHLGSAPTLLMMAAAAGLFCLFARQFKSVAVIFGSIAVSLGVSHLTSFLYTRSVPDVLFDVAEIYTRGFPSSHASLAVAVFGSVYYWVWNHPGRVRLRTGVAFGVLVALLMISFSRVYFGILFPSEVVAGYCLGFSAVIVAGTVARNAQRIIDIQRRADFAALAVGVLAIIVAAIAYNARPVPPAVREVYANVQLNSQDVSAALIVLPKEARNLSGRPKLPVNIVSLDAPTTLVSMLQIRGWKEVEPDAFFTHRIAEPLFPAFIDTIPARFTLSKDLDEERLVIRFWPSGDHVDGRRLWVGSVVKEQKRQRWWRLTTYRIDPDVDLALETFYLETGTAMRSDYIKLRERGLYNWRQPHFTHGKALLFD